MATQTTPEQRLTAINKITNRKYREEVSWNEDKTGKVSIFHDHGMFSPATIVNFLALSKRIGKEISLVSWPNNEAVAYVKGKMSKRKKVYFFLFGEPELETYFSSPFASDHEMIKTYSSNGKIEKYKYWKHDAQLANWSDYFQVFDLSNNGSSTSIDGSIYHFRSFKNVTVSLTSLIMSNIPDEISKYAITEIINNCFSILKAARERRNYEKIADEFLNRYKTFSMNALKVLPQNLEYKISDLLERMRSNYVAINNTEREIEANKHLLEGARKNLNNFDEYFKKENENLKSVLITSFKSKFKDISFESNAIIAYTRPIYINCIIPQSKGGDGATVRRFLIGEFKITIKTNESYVYLKNISNTHRSSSSFMDHPHVRDARPCLGNLKEEVPKLIKQSDFIAVFLLMYDYLTSVNPDGWYENILNWTELAIINRATGSVDDEDEEEDEEEETDNQRQAEEQNA